MFTPLSKGSERHQQGLWGEYTIPVRQTSWLIERYRQLAQAYASTTASPQSRRASAYTCAADRRCAGEVGPPTTFVRTGGGPSGEASESGGERGDGGVDQAVLPRR